MSSFIPYGHQDILEEDIAVVAQVLRGDFLTQGPAIDAFEASLGEFLNAKHTVAVSNGTAGLHIANLALGIQPGDAVIVPAITFAATSNAVLYCGATPIFADIEYPSGGICPKSVIRCIDIAKKKGLTVKAISPVQFAGRPYDVKAIVEIAAQHRLSIIEDACHAFGARFRLQEGEAFQKVGSSNLVAMSVFSFHPVKHITTGEGGAVTTSDPEIDRKLRMLRTHGITKDSSQFKNSSRAFTGTTKNPWYMEMQTLGLNYRLCDIQAALGKSQIMRAEQFIRRRREIAAQYDKAFKGIDGVIAAAGDTSNYQHAYHLYPLMIQFKHFGHTRVSFMEGLKENGVGSQVHYIPVPWHPFYESHRNIWAADQLTAAADFYESELSIPMYSKMTDKDVERVISTVLRLVKR